MEVPEKAILALRPLLNLTVSDEGVPYFADVEPIDHGGAYVCFYAWTGEEWKQVRFKEDVPEEVRERLEP